MQYQGSIMYQMVIVMVIVFSMVVPHLELPEANRLAGVENPEEMEDISLKCGEMCNFDFRSFISLDHRFIVAVLVT